MRSRTGRPAGATEEDAGRPARIPDRPVPRVEAPSMHVETTERSVSLAVLTELLLMMITGIASSRRLGGPGVSPVRRICK
ncbi:hypothetical protein AQJ64_13020 [Streptomyces griseoruber]|uniref:Uncharacterized protein n=1 Tax=Streptomyces griseoruber TaxID=1943 RepID=A0A101T3M4_9ACTN|nr:hypothetical protein AQJ64_13020 [Streptomyces griseoruber]